MIKIALNQRELLCFCYYYYSTWELIFSKPYVG